MEQINISGQLHTLARYSQHISALFFVGKVAQQVGV
jgi:hypothetical protein